MTMSETELFAAAVVSATNLSDGIVDTLEDLDLDAIVATHTGLSIISFVTEGPTAISAVKNAVQTFADIGVRVTRTHPDLVTRQAIAERTELSRQAIGNWIRGERMATDPFPAPVNLVGGGVWLWGDVNNWLKRQDRRADPVQHLNLTDHTILDNWLATNKIGTTRGNFQDAHVAIKAKSIPGFMRTIHTSPVVTSSWIRIEATR